MEHKPWLSLPDEDPPERGLAELMAAARAKAEVMAHPPWWKRLADLLKRPPVLALATVIVLIGGVIVVHRSPEEMSAPAASPPSATESVRPAVREVAQPPTPAEHAAERPARIEKPATTGKKADSANTETKLAPPDTGHVETGSVEVDLASKQQVVDAPALDDAVTPQRQQVENEAIVKQLVGRGVTTKKPGETQKKAGPSAADSLARCRAAATNKDCAGARACAKQLESESPAFYKANVANDATLKPCL